MNYQDTLTERKRQALWRQLVDRKRQEAAALAKSTPWDAAGHSGKRRDQVSFSLCVVVFFSGVFLAGCAIGAIYAVIKSLP